MINPITSHPDEASTLVNSQEASTLDAWMSELVERGRLPFAMTVIARSEGVAYWRWCGLSHPRKGMPPTQDTPMRMYSMTKAMTALTALVLEDQGRLDLNASVEQHLPELADWTVLRHPESELNDVIALESGPTLLQLLTHTSGISYGISQDSMLDRTLAQRMWDNTTLAGLLDALSELPLLFTPGTAWHYGYGLDVLGLVLMRVTGKSLGELFDELVFSPLGMADTSFEIRPSETSCLAALFESEADGRLTEITKEPALGPRIGGTQGSTPGDDWGGSGLVSTPADWLKFVDLLRAAHSGKETAVASPEVVRRMATNQLEGDIAALLPEGPEGFREWMPFEGLGMGLGVWVAEDTERLAWASNPGEFGWGGVANTVFWIDPVADAAVLFFTQVLPSSRLGLRNDLHRLVADCLN
ncbi:MAG: serine hydrolase domain-containing protein [SAR324 cluster bacterium]|nr:serine hydrolase domain-containing protein [SAR324 cluster bacterium]